MEQLFNSIKQGNTILFVGAGVSMNLGLPSWSQLIDKIAEDLSYDPDIYRTFGDNYALAEYYKIKKGSIGPLRSWMDRSWSLPSKKIEDSKIHELITHINFPIIYTTNYDRWIEEAFKHYRKPYTKISSVSDITKISNNHAQIIKFHGDFDDDNSIVLDESSYFERLEFQTPLDIKFRSDVLGKTVLFIGYSLADINIRILFYKLSKMWSASTNGEAKPRSYIFSPRPNPVQEAILDRWGISMITSEIEQTGLALEDFLTQLSESTKI